MKIVITSDIYYPMTNGVAVFAHNLAGGLVKRGHEVMVICPSFNGQAYREVEEGTGVIVNYLKSTRVPFYPDQINRVPDKKELLGLQLPRLVYRYGIWTALFPYPELKQILDEFQPDVIHNQTAETIAVATVSYARKHKIPLVSTGHAYPDNITGQLKLLKPVKKPVDAVLRAYMASFLKNSEYATMPTEMAIDDLVPKDRKRFKVPVEALSNGVNLEAFCPGKVKKAIVEKYNLPEKDPVVLYVGRVDPEKSIDRAIKAFERASRQDEKIKMVVVGDGIDRPRLEKLVESLGIQAKVQFLGRVLPPDLMEVYKIGKIFITASETETQGIVLIEAAAMGLPIVAVDAGAVKEICQDGVNGVLCRPKDEERMAQGILELVSDEKKWVEYSKNSMKIAKKHDLTHTLRRFEEIYQIAINLKK